MNQEAGLSYQPGFFIGHCGFLIGVFLVMDYFKLGFAVVAPRASYSFAAAQKSNQKRPPLQLRPVKDTGFPTKRRSYHAAPELAKNAQTGGTESSC